MKALLVLEDGFTLEGKSFTGEFETGGEVIFTTAMGGYQEILTDPSYYGQMICMTYPLIGNYGITPEDMTRSMYGASSAPQNVRHTRTSASVKTGPVPAWSTSGS